MLNNMILKAYTTAQIAMMPKNDPRIDLQNDAGITAIEYAIIGVAMASGLFYIFDEGGFLSSLETAWLMMSTKILGAGTILNK